MKDKEVRQHARQMIEQCDAFVIAGVNDDEIEIATLAEQDPEAMEATAVSLSEFLVDKRPEYVNQAMMDRFAELIQKERSINLEDAR